MRCHAFLALLLVAGAATAVQAQGPVPAGRDSSAVPAIFYAPDAVPGSVVSVAVRVPVHAGAGSAEFVVRPGTRVKLYGEPRGVLRWTTDESVLPLTFSVPRDEAAGIMHIAQVIVRWADGAEWIADVQTRVSVRRQLELQLDTSSVIITRGGQARLGFTLRNGGNATDTVTLSFFKPAAWNASAPPALAVAAGESRTGEIRITAPGDAFLGETQIIRLAASGLGSEAAANVSFEVASEVDDRATWVHMPATVIVGVGDAAAIGSSIPAVGLQASGPIGRGTEASLLVRHAPYDYTAPAFQRYLAGPSFRAEVRRGDQRVTIGDIMLGGSPLLGSYMQANGVDGEVKIGSVTTNMFAARPFQLDAPQRDGHLLSARSEMPVGPGTAGLAIADLERPYGVNGATEQTRLATASYEADVVKGLDARAEAGIMQLEDRDGRTRSGMSLDVHTQYRNERLNLSGRLRRVPGALATSGSSVDETFISGALDLGRGLSLNAWGISNSVELLDDAGSTHNGGLLGVRWQRGRAAAQLSASQNSTTGSGLIGDNERRSITLSGTAPLGAFTMDGTLEIGRASAHDIEQPLRNASARINYQRGSAWAWLGTSHSLGLFGTDLHRVDLGGSVRTARIELDGSIGTYLGQGDAHRNLNAWLSTMIHTDTRTAFIVGVDYSPWNPASSGVRVSVGARRSFGLPLPLRRRPVVEGTVYDDRNGNLRRDGGEPPIANVLVHRGGMLTRTDHAGHYAFFEDHVVTAELRIDVASLAAGMLLPPDVELHPVGHVDVPVHRAASLRMVLFNDADGDNARAGTERPASARTVELIDDRGRTRTAMADENGVILFRALSPGAYTVRGFGTNGLRAIPGQPLHITLEPASTTEIQVPVPFERVEIRFRTPPVPDTLTTIVGAAGDRDAGAPAAGAGVAPSNAAPSGIRSFTRVATRPDTASTAVALPRAPEPRAPVRLAARTHQPEPPRPAPAAAPVRSRWLVVPTIAFGFGVAMLLLFGIGRRRRREDER